MSGASVRLSRRVGFKKVSEGHIHSAGASNKRTPGARKWGHRGL